VQHILVARAFIPNPLSLPEVNHKNGKEKANNHVSNLEWVTRQGNEEHAFKTGLKARGSKSGSAKLYTHQVVEIRKKLAQGYSIASLAKEYGVWKTFST
jgi:hypothetical protein